MSDLKINCPHCNQSLEAPPELLGETVDCPACNKPIDVPASNIPSDYIPRIDICQYYLTGGQG